MSRSDVPMKDGRCGRPIDDPTDAEVAAIYDEFGWCSVPENARGAKMHIALDHETGLPLCSLAEQNRASDYRPKTMGTYPQGYKELCNFCVHIWRGDSSLGDGWGDD